jgi:hypothetical protein
MRQLSSLHKSKVISVDDVIAKSTAYESGALEKSQGCTENEILEVEDKFGTLPVVYKNIMMAIGKRVGNSNACLKKEIESRPQIDFYLKDVFDLSLTMTTSDPEDLSNDPPFPDNIFFIYGAYSSRVFFVLTNQHNYDAPVFIEDWSRTYSDEKYIPVKAFESIWDWIDDYLEGKPSIW